MGVCIRTTLAAKHIIAWQTFKQVNTMTLLLMKQRTTVEEEKEEEEEEEEQEEMITLR
jgi:energy-converting hydrogenase Eha subunit E